MHHAVFPDNMSGFLLGHSCCSALLKLTDDWRQALDNKKDVPVVAVGLSKGFDSICHSLLLAKLKVYGVHDSAIRLIQSYLSGRFHRVKCNEKVSDWLPLRLGVPQGSLLGPLFLKYLCEWCQLLSWIFLPTSVCWWHNAVYSPWKPLHTWIYTESRHREINRLVHCELPASKRH